MNAPDWQGLKFEPGILLEPSSDGDRLVLWVPSDRDREFQYWERIGKVARAEVSSDHGVHSIAATAVRTRQRHSTGLGALWHRLFRSKRDREFTLPDGAVAERCGERRTDLALVWLAPNGETLDETRVHARWPEAKQLERLADRLFLVSGVKRAGEHTGPGEPELEAPPDGANPREFAERLLAAARESRDPQREATALTDLGVTILNEGDARTAITHLERALALARQLGDHARESDVIGNLGTAMLSVRQPARAAELFQQELVYARTQGDRFGEKLALERLGVACWNIRDFQRALAFFEQALQLTRQLGDRHQEAALLWHQAIQQAELGQRELAIARAEEAVTLFKLLGKPQAAWYGAYLQKYRMGLSESVPAAGARAEQSPASYLGGSVVASVMAGQPASSGAATSAAPTTTSGPGLLRMAMSATKAMAGFVGSGFKTASPEVQKKRLQVCARCEHHTGVRCKICGCFTNVKSRMLHEDCPIGKWPA